MFGGSNPVVNSTTFTGLLRYRMDNGMGFHGGLRASKVDAAIDLRGTGFGGASGYSLRFDDAWGAGFALGASYERPATATRVVLTYQSRITHDFDTVETGPFAGTGSTEVTTPRSWNLEAQTGIAPGTLLTGSIRWVKWSEFKVEPVAFKRATGGGMVVLKDTTTYTIGLGRKFTDTWSGAASFTYEPSADIVDSPLSPTNGRAGLTLAAVYTQGPIKVTGAVGYFRLGDTSPQTGNPRAVRANFEDNDSVAVALKVGYSF